MSPHHITSKDIDALTAGEGLLKKTNLQKFQNMINKYTDLTQPHAAHVSIIHFHTQIS